MGKTKEYLEKMHHDNLNEMRFVEQERLYLTHFNEKQGLDTTKERNDVKTP